MPKIEFDDVYKKLNTIYIISKGRPQCKTAATLTKLEYPGQWFIVCGNNDESLPDYQKKWGNDKVLVFDWYEEVKQTDFLDNLGVEKYASGASPVRNATRKISDDRGELRHWQLDDDYLAFTKINTDLKLYKRINGEQLEFEMAKIAQFGYEADLENIGFQPSSNTYPDKAFSFSKRVFNAHNLPSEEDKFVRWSGRLNDDTVNAIDVIKKGGYEISFNYLGMATILTQTESGGLTDLYKDSGTIQKTAYAILASPVSTKLIIRYGRYHHQNNWLSLSPKLIRQNHAKV